ncbi:MAG: aspartate carbamoyltransferase catalytic subunit [Phycisphaerales bacterium]|nr:aspartate carbamoyltransferase catalytic subunit [Phycisphaerales bacterium]
MNDLSDAALAELFARARAFETGEALPGGRLQGRFVVNLFYENSTRTRVSFEVAAKRLGAEVVNVTPAGTSVAKGESLVDTVRTIEANGPDVIVFRHQDSGAPEVIERETKAAVINAGDGSRGHPTQALLDAMTLQSTLQRERLDGLMVAMVGDVIHSRVARSNMDLLPRLGARVRLVGPSCFVADGFRDLGFEVAHDLEEGLRGCDVVMMLRVQLERHQGVSFGSTREYHRRYGLTKERLDRCAPQAWVMHPGPTNRGVEMTDEVMDDPRCLVRSQVEHGMFVRMAALDMLVSGGAA